MTQNLTTAIPLSSKANAHPILRLQTPEPFTCTICQSTQQPPSGPDDLWQCAQCAQPYFGHAEPGIVLSDAQIATLRQFAGRDDTGNSTIVPNWWTQRNQPVGKD